MCVCVCVCVPEKGFCMRGDMCPFDHGSDPVVVEDVNLPNILPFQPPPSQPPPGLPPPPPLMTPPPAQLRPPVPPPGSLPPSLPPVTGNYTNTTSYLDLLSDIPVPAHRPT